MKIILTVLLCLCVPLMGADKKPLTKEQSAKVIEYAIHGAGGKGTLRELTKADFERVWSLFLYNKQLTDVTALEKLTQLTELHLGGNRLTDVKGLEKLTQLRDLSLHGNKLTDVKGLEKHTQLTKLHLANNQLTDVTGLEKLTKLKELHLYNNKLTDVTGLEKLDQLRTLFLANNPDLTKAQIDQLQKALPQCNISHNAKLNKEESAKVIEAAIHGAVEKPTYSELTKADFERVRSLFLYNKQLTDVTALEKLTQLTELHLGGNRLTDVKGLEKLTQLRLLVLSDNQLTDVKGLEKLTQLKVLGLTSNKLTDVKDLEKLTQLTMLDLRGNPDLTKAQIAELKKALPKCDIVSNPKK